MYTKPKYLEIIEDIKNQIIHQKYHVGDKIPSERELAVIYSAARVTVQKAMNDLELEGYIERIHGKGMFVLNPLDEDNIYIMDNEKSDSILGFSREFKNRVKITSKLITLKVIKAGTHLAKHLNIDENDDVYFIRRVRLINDVPAIVEDSNIPLKIIKEIPRDVLEKGSFYEYVEKVTGKKIKDADSLIEASLFNAELANLLAIEVGAPMLKISEVTRLDDKTNFNYSHSYNKADIIKIKNKKIEK